MGTGKRPVRVRPARRLRPGIRRARRAGESLTCLVLASGSGEWVGADLASGALVRNPFGESEEPSPLFSSKPLEVIRFVLGEQEEPPDLSRPEAVTCAAPPEILRPLRRRAQRRLLRRLAVPGPATSSVVGGHGPSVAYVDLDGSSPSVVLVRVAGKEIGLTAANPGAVLCDLTGNERGRPLPVIDPTARAVAEERAPQALYGTALAAAIGFRPGFAVLGLAGVEAGHVKKVLFSLLPR